SHVDFASPAFFGRRSVKPKRARKLSLCQIIFDRDRRKRRGDAEKVVPTTVARGARDERLLLGRAGLLRHPRQSLEFAQNADDGFPAAVTGHERGGNLRDILLKLKTGGAEFGF